MYLTNHQERVPDIYQIKWILNRLAVLFLCGLLTGCAPTSPTASEDKARFVQLCNATDRNFTKETPVVDGYAEGPENNRTFLCPTTGKPFKRLIIEGYDYYECFETPWIERQGEFPSVLRISLKATGDPACNHPRIQKENNYAQLRAGDYSQLRNKCFGAEERDYVESRYIVLHGAGAVSKKGNHLNSFPKGWDSRPGSIFYSRGLIVDLTKEIIIAEQKSYRYLPSGSRYVDITGYEKCDADILDVSTIIKSK